MKEGDLIFLKRRKRFADSWNLVGTFILIVLCLLFLVLLRISPYLVNPFHVIRQIAAGNIEQRTLELMACLLPVLVLKLFAVIVLFIIYGFAIFADEKRYQRIISSELNIYGDNKS